LEELEEINDNPKAAVEATEEVKGWRAYP